MPANTLNGDFSKCKLTVVTDNYNPVVRLNSSADLYVRHEIARFVQNYLLSTCTIININK